MQQQNKLIEKIIEHMFELIKILHQQRVKF